MQSETQYTPPAFYPLTLEEAKLHLRVDGTEDDTYIQALIIAGTGYVENATGVQMIDAVWDLTIDAVPTNGIIDLNHIPVTEIVSITYYDADNDPQTLATDDYNIIANGVHITDAPTVYARDDAITIRYHAGYADDTCPELLKVCLKMLVGEFYKTREESVTGTIISAVPMGVDRLVSQYKQMIVK